MLIRKEKGSYMHAIIVRTGMSLVIITLAYTLFWLLTHQSEDEIIYTNTELQIGEAVIVSGLVSVDNQFPHYTHTIQTQDQLVYGINSPSINLNAYIGYIELYGTIEKIINGIPVIGVQTIKIPDQKTIIQNNNIYLFTDALLRLDFSSQPNFSAQRINTDTLQIYFNEIPYAKIHYSTCNKVNLNQDCNNLYEQFSYDARENFRSFQGYNFYRKRENDPRTTFNEDLFIYTFTPEEDNRDTFPETTYMIDFINKSYLLDKQQNMINQRCKSIESETFSIDSSSMNIENNELILNLTGKINNTIAAHCTIGFDIRNNFQVTINTLEKLK